MQTPSENEQENDNSARRLGSVKKLILLNNIRIQLIEQMYFLDLKMNSHSDLVNELTDFLRERYQLECNYSCGLEKIVTNLQTNSNDLTNKNHRPYTCWQYLIAETKYLSQEHVALSDIYNASMQHKSILKTYKKCQDLLNEAHEEVLRILRNFYIIVNTYNTCQNQLKRAGTGSKFNNAQRKKVLQNTNSSNQNETHLKEYLENLKARDVYKHYMETFSTTINKHMLKHLRDILYSMDSGFSLMVSNAILAHVNFNQAKFYKKLFCLADESMTTLRPIIQNDKNIENSQTNLHCLLESIKQRQDIPEMRDETQIKNTILLQFELQLQYLKQKEESLENDLEKIYRIWDLMDINTIDSLKTPDNDIKSKSLSVVKQFSLKNYHKSKSENKPILNRPKLFGGSLEEYIRLTNEQIPLILKSCIRVITLFGLKSQGIFRVSGSQVEILNLRDAFERGDDPLANATDRSDINSVAGVLKLYLRELEEPLFPAKYFDLFISLIQMDSNQDIIAGIRNFLKNFSDSVVIVIRYLFSFLHHLSQYANENMMDAFNLAVSFGPTLMPAPGDKKQVQYQTQLNDLIKLLIIHNKHIFPKDLEGPHYNETISDAKQLQEFGTDGNFA